MNGKFAHYSYCCDPSTLPQLGAGPFERARRAFPHGRGARAGMMMNPTPYWRIEHEHQAHARGAFGWF